jgi:hypothetical protein
MHPGGDLRVPGFTGKLPGGAQVLRRGGVIAVQVDRRRGGQQGQPAAHDQQAAVLGERRAGVQQSADVAEVAPHPAEQVTRRRTG